MTPTFTILYSLVKPTNSKSPSRYDCETSTGNYPEFETLKQHANDGKFKIHVVSVPTKFKGNNTPDVSYSSITLSNGTNLSRMFILDPNNRRVGYGDVNGTNDALIFVISEDYTRIEIFIALGMKHKSRDLCIAFIRGYYDGEIEQLRQEVKAANPSLFDSL
jgi:hypothetical protein